MSLDSHIKNDTARNEIPLTLGNLCTTMHNGVRYICVFLDETILFNKVSVGNVQMIVNFRAFGNKWRNVSLI